MTLFNHNSYLPVNPEVPSSPNADSATLLRALHLYSIEAPDSLDGVVSSAADAARAEVERRGGLLLHADRYADRDRQENSESEARQQACTTDTGVFASPAEDAPQEDSADDTTIVRFSVGCFALGEGLREEVTEAHNKALTQTELSLTLPQAVVATHALRRSARKGDVAASDLLGRRPSVLRPAVSSPASYAIGALLAISRAFGLR